MLSSLTAHVCRLTKSSKCLPFMDEASTCPMIKFLHSLAVSKLKLQQRPSLKHSFKSSQAKKQSCPIIPWSRTNFFLSVFKVNLNGMLCVTSVKKWLTSMSYFQNQVSSSSTPPPPRHSLTYGKKWSVVMAIAMKFSE